MTIGECRKTLARRLAHLQKRTSDNARTDLSFDRAEISALEKALTIIDAVRELAAERGAA